MRALELLNGVELPALEDGCVNKNLLVSTTVGFVVPFYLTFSQVKVDEKNKVFLDAYQAQKMKTDVRSFKTMNTEAVTEVSLGR